MTRKCYKLHKKLYTVIQMVKEDCFGEAFGCMLFNIDQHFIFSLRHHLDSVAQKTYKYLISLLGHFSFYILIRTQLFKM